MKKLILLTMVLLLIPLAFSLEICQDIVEPPDVPCVIVSAWNYTSPCSNHKALTYNSSGDNIINYTFGNFTNSGLCSFNFNISTKGSYTFRVGNGDIGQVLVRLDNMQLGLVIGLVSVIAIFLFLSFKLEEEHGILKLLLIFLSVPLIGLIPVVYIIDDPSIIFYKLVMGFTIVFWLYVAGYLAYWALTKAGWVVPKNENKP